MRMAKRKAGAAPGATHHHTLGRPVAVTTHPLLLRPAEVTHILDDTVEAACESNPELCPGINCCATCAKEHADKEPLTCPQCNAVEYCSKEHMNQDKKVHAQVCKQLKYLQQAGSVSATDAYSSKEQPAAGPTSSGVTADYAVKQASSSVGAAANGHSTEIQQQEDSAAPAAAAVNGDAPAHVEEDAPAQGPVTHIDVFLANFQQGVFSGQEQHGWYSMMPAAYQRVYQPAGDVRPDMSMHGGPLVAAAGAVGVTDSSGRTIKRAKTEVPAGADEHVAGADEAAAAQDTRDLALAMQLGSVTALLSYPYTAAYTLADFVCCSDLVRRCSAQQRPLSLLVIGASAEAELAHLPAWKVVPEALGCPVRILFTGLDVDEEVDCSCLEGSQLSVECFKGTYEDWAASDKAYAPDALLAFNPGLTCPDYDWQDTLACLRSAGSRGQGSGCSIVPLLVATNTFLEARMEQELMTMHGWQAVEPIQRNPYTSLQLLQSGTMANDLYRKNAWLAAYQPKPSRQTAWRGLRSALTSWLQPVTGLLQRLGGRTAQ